MSAGLPGFGLGGVFFILSALLAPLAELPRVARGESSRERWAAIGRQLAIAAGMALSVVATLAVLGVVKGGSVLAGVTAFSLFPLVSCTVLLALVVSTAKAASFVFASQRARRPRRPAYGRALRPAESTEGG